MITPERYQELVQECKEYDKAFHTEGIALIPDYAYDAVRRLILEYEQANPNDISLDSPNLRVGEISKDLLTIQHGSRMLSLKNVNSVPAINEIVDSWYEAYGEKLVVFMEAKFDGMAIDIRYKDGVLDVCATRGDGDKGRDITLTLRDLVQETIDTPGIVEFKGEVVFRANMLDVYNEYRIAAGQDPVANDRSAVHSILTGNKDFNRLIVSKYIEIVIFDAFSDTIVFRSRSDDMSEFITNSGFSTPTQYICKNKDSFEGLLGLMIRQYSKRRSEDGFLLDGLVVKVDSIAISAAIGATSTHPKWAYAYKFEPLGGKTEVWKADYTVGRTGVITPMLYVNPIKISGVIIEKASLANASKVFKLDVRIGDTVYIYRGGDVIPQVGYVVSRAKGGGTKVEWPTHCPCCNTLLVDIGAKSYCQNDGCTDRIIAQLVHFFSKPGVHIPGINESVFTKLVRDLGVRNPLDVLRLTPEAVSSEEAGLGRNAAIVLNRGIASIHKNPTLLRSFIYALGIPGVGPSTSTNMQMSLLNAEALMQMADPKVAKKLKIFNFAQESAQSVADFLTAKKEMVEGLIEICTPVFYQPTMRKLKNAAVDGKTFVLTGEMPELRQTLTDRITLHGAAVVDKVSKKTDYLIVGEKPANKKIKSADKYSIPKLTYEELIVLLTVTE